MSAKSFPLKISLASFIVLLTACAARYQPPIGDEVARLRVVGPQTAWSQGINAITYPSGKCEDPMSLGYFGGIARIGDQQRPLGIAGFADLDPRSFIERAIPASRLNLITLRSISHTTTCVVTFSFHPVAGADYEARMEWDQKKCYVNLRKVTEQNGTAFYLQEKSSKQEARCAKGLT